MEILKIKWKMKDFKKMDWNFENKIKFFLNVEWNFF